MLLACARRTHHHRTTRASPPRRSLIIRMVSSITVKPLPPHNQEYSQNKDHHIGSPAHTFQNPWNSFQKLGLVATFQHRFGNHPEKKFVPVPQGPNGTRSAELVKVRKPDWGAGDTAKLKTTWLGHASFLIEFPAPAGADRGIRVLCDPVFSERTSPTQWIGPKRYTPPPCTLDELPDIDIIAISHDHYDHLDLATIQHIYTRHNGNIHFIAGLNNKPWFLQNIGCQASEATDADWWDTFAVSVAELGEVKITCCPTQHGSGRVVGKFGQTLWCSFAFEAGGKRVYFAGDTAYQALNTPAPCPAFKQVGETLGPFDLAMLPIGLMTPHSFMGGVHATPEQSLRIHEEVKSRLSLGMHYGTVRGGISGQYEDVRDPPRRWRVAAEKDGVWCGGGVEGDGRTIDTTKSGVGLCDVGETVMV